MFVIVMLVGKLVHNNLISISIQAIVGICIYVGGLYIIKDELLINLCEQIKNKLHKNTNVTEI